MLEKILVFEREAFFFLNGSNSSYLDNLMWFYTGKIVWLPLAIFILFILVYKKNWRESLLILISIALVITLCDQFASHVFKPIFERYRPTYHPDFMDQVDIVYNYRGGRYGFISSHAANSFGFAMYLSLLLKNRFLTTSIFLWAFFTAYSRIYLGVHFISDIIPAMLLGILIGYLVYKINIFVRYKLWKGQINFIYSKKDSNLIAYAILISILFLICFCNLFALFL